MSTPYSGKWKGCLFHAGLGTCVPHYRPTQITWPFHARCSSLSRCSRVHRNSLYPFGYSVWPGVARHPRSAGTDPLESIYSAYGVPHSSRQGHRHRGGPHKSSTSSRGHRVVSCLIMLLLLIMHTSDSPSPLRQIPRVSHLIAPSWG